MSLLKISPRDATLVSAQRLDLVDRAEKPTWSMGRIVETAKCVVDRMANHLRKDRDPTEYFPIASHETVMNLV